MLASKLLLYHMLQIKLTFKFKRDETCLHTFSMPVATQSFLAAGELDHV